MTTIERMRRLIGVPGRRRPEQLAHFALPERPGWAHAKQIGNSPLALVFDHAQEVFRKGTICWGYIVVANEVLNQPGPESCSPAAVVWSVDPFVDRFPHFLAMPAQHLKQYFEVATFAPQPPSAHFTYLHMRDWYATYGNLAVPPYLTDGRLVHLCEMPIFRAHLPKGYLTGKLMPLLVLPKSVLPAMGMAVPCAIWPEELRRAWERG
jgi:hypothetical protein